VPALQGAHSALQPIRRSCSNQRRRRIPDAVKPSAAHREVSGDSRATMSIFDDIYAATGLPLRI
jgi:hypothetical protein